jgi:hypothetical protein
MFEGKQAIQQFIAEHVTDINYSHWRKLELLIGYGKERPIFLSQFKYVDTKLVFTQSGMTYRVVTLSKSTQDIFNVTVRTNKSEDLFKLSLHNALKLFTDFTVIGFPTKESQLRLMLDRYNAN